MTENERGIHEACSTRLSIATFDERHGIGYDDVVLSVSSRTVAVIPKCLIFGIRVSIGLKKDAVVCGGVGGVELIWSGMVCDKDGE